MASETVGNSVLISIASTAVGTQKGGKLSVDVNGIDVSSKADDWARVAAGRKKWSFSLDGVVSTGAGGSMGLLPTVLLGQIVTFSLEDDVSGDTLTGSALITKWERTDPDDDASTYAVEGTGHGALVYTPAGS